MTFQDWLNEVNTEVLKVTQGQIDMYSLSDWLSRDAFDGGLEPDEAAMEALENDDLGSEFLAELGLL